MCGLIGGALPVAHVEAALASITHRGPDSQAVEENAGWALGHSLLAVQGSVPQPYRAGTTLLTYNGELWNPERLPGWTGSGDTPAVAALIAADGPESLPLIDGMFALAWSDGTGAVHLARDTFGEVPLHWGRTDSGVVVWASEIGPLLTLGAVPSSVRWVPPGHVVTAHHDRTVQITRWTDPVDITPNGDSFDTAVMTLRGLWREAVISRMTSDVPVAVLLSGGLDSSSVVATLVDEGYDVHPYIAKHYAKSSDVRHARQIASYYNLTLNEVAVPQPTRATLAEAVRVAEQPHKAQVEITVACLELARVIAADGFRVVLSGEGSDELWASYGGLAYHGIKRDGWHGFRHKLFTEQHRKNFARVNKVFMAEGIEARMPFLHVDLARYALRLSIEAVSGGPRPHPKAVLASMMSPPLPPETAWRTKRAFQTDARLDAAAAATVAAPAKFYRAEFATRFRGVAS